MTQYNTLNTKLSNSQLNKSKSGDCPEVNLNLLSNLMDSCNYKTNFPHKFLLTKSQVLKLWKAVANDLSANMKS